MAKFEQTPCLLAHPVCDLPALVAAEGLPACVSGWARAGAAGRHPERGEEIVTSRRAGPRYARPPSASPDLLVSALAANVVNAPLRAPAPWRTFRAFSKLRDN